MSVRPDTIVKNEKIVGCEHSAAMSDSVAIIWLGHVYEFVDTDKKLTRAQWAVLCVPCFDQYRDGDEDMLARILVNVFFFNHDVKVDRGAEA